MTDTDLLEIEDLHAGHDGSAVLHGVDLSIAPGEIACLIGRNGMGKTTLLKTLTGLLPGQGRIVFRGVDLLPLAPHRRARLGIGYVPQGRGLFPQMTVEDNIRCGHRVGADDGDRRMLGEAVEALFPLLRERRHQAAGTMSGGEQQQVAIARALVGNPALLLLDEPSEGIQPSIIDLIGSSLIEFNRLFGTTILLVEQNIDLVLSMARSCHVLEKGKVTHSLPNGAPLSRDLLCGFLELR